MSNIYAHKKYKVTFNKPEYDATYTIIRQKSGAFKYGNGTMVLVLRNGEKHELLDTRYDRLVMKDFEQWCIEYLEQAFDPIFEARWEELKGQPYFA